MASQPQTAVHPKRADKLNRDLLTQLKEFENTPEEERWPGATWPTPRAFRDAEIFIHKLPLDSIPMPNMGLADDGEVNFLWKEDGVHVDLGFYGTSAYSYFARGKSGNKIYEEDALVSDDFPGEIPAMFKNWQDRAFVVIDTATEDNPGHASIYFATPQKGKVYAREARGFLLPLLQDRMTLDEAYDGATG